MKPAYLAVAFAGLLVTSAAAADVAFKNANFDISKLHRENFYELLVPLAKKNGKVVMYNFAGSFGKTWNEGLIKKFEAKYGIKVEYSDVQSPQADQQLVAVHASGTDSPVDAYFTAGGLYPLLHDGKVIADVNLAKIVPNMATYDPKLAETVFGKKHGGSYNLIHLNQTAIGYDSASVKPDEVPANFDQLLAWAEKHPKKLAITSPSKGGSGEGFIYSVAMNYLDGDCKAKLLDFDTKADQMNEWALKSDCLKPVWDYFSRLVKAAEFTNGNADTLNLINNHAAFMGTVWEDQVMVFLRNKQLPTSFRLTLLEKGQAGGGDALIIPANAKNVAGALLLLDMAMGKEFQTWKLENAASRSPKIDVTADNVSAEMRPYFLSPSVFPKLSLQINWDMADALVAALDEKVLNK